MEALTQLIGFPREEILRVPNQLIIFLKRDLTRTGRGAAFNLMEHTGPRARFINTVRAITQTKSALQGIERAVDGPRTGKGAVIIALNIACAAMLGNLRGRMRLAHKDIRKAFIIAQQDIITRL